MNNGITKEDLIKFLVGKPLRVTLNGSLGKMKTYDGICIKIQEAKEEGLFEVVFDGRDPGKPGDLIFQFVPMTMTEDYVEGFVSLQIPSTRRFELVPSNEPVVS